MNYPSQVLTAVSSRSGTTRATNLVGKSRGRFASLLTFIFVNKEFLAQVGGRSLRTVMRGFKNNDTIAGGRLLFSPAVHHIAMTMRTAAPKYDR